MSGNSAYPQKGQSLGYSNTKGVSSNCFHKTYKKVDNQDNKIEPRIQKQEKPFLAARNEGSRELPSKKPGLTLSRTDIKSPLLTALEQLIDNKKYAIKDYLKALRNTKVNEEEKAIRQEIIDTYQTLEQLRNQIADYRNQIADYSATEDCVRSVLSSIL
jgi:hypothetical protein